MLQREGTSNATMELAGGAAGTSALLTRIGWQHCVPGQTAERCGLAGTDLRSLWTPNEGKVM
ncbi:hypothetical protein GCM10022236_01190 [Microlunatus ginsengisoli]|uniref:Uncharacterized protein n=1 Tax=Microlunatus ginsengisoli TaxID=363863 RepID=A0ABP6ZDZ7_9ACTN